VFNKVIATVKLPENGSELFLTLFKWSVHKSGDLREGRSRETGTGNFVETEREIRPKVPTAI